MPFYKCITFSLLIYLLRKYSNKNIPKNILLSSYISALLTYHKRSFFLKQMRKNTEKYRESHPDKMKRVRDLESLSPQKYVSVKYLPSSKWLSQAELNCVFGGFISYGQFLVFM